MAKAPSLPRPPWRERLKERVTRLNERFGRARRGLSWTAITVGGLGAAVALWPLATAVWDLLGFTTGQTWRVAAVGICALVLATGVVGVNWKRTAPVRLVWLILVAWALAVGMVAGMTVLAWLVLDSPQWKPPEALTPQNLDAIATRAFAIVAGLGGVALLVIAYRRQRSTENGEERETTKLFTERFTTASEQLGSEHAAVRLAGVHALAHLADDAPQEREDLVQMVIDVLCAYLRMPYEPRPDEPSGKPDQSSLPAASPTTAVDLGRLRGIDPDVQHEKQQEAREEYRRRVLEFEASQQVRHTIIRIIGNRLREDTRWRGKDYDFTGVVFDSGDLTGSHFSGGMVSFDGAVFSGGAVSFDGTEFSGGRVSFARAIFSGRTVSFFEAVFSGGMVSFDGAVFSGGMVSFDGAVFSGGAVSFVGTEFSGGRVYFGGAVFSGGAVSFGRAEFSGGRVFFDRAVFSGGAVYFGVAKFSGGRVYFGGAVFSGGRVSFVGTKFFGGMVSFEKASGTCPRGLLEAMDRPGMVLPEQWRRASDGSGEEAP
ncbi:pentapeptide repeat-containing protein [Nocardiopsis alba]|uniref:pentapeptide repeat-containing protein n=1 Tax=Nocardiopsis alba TaxID=53437 RepID=UPI0033A3BE53